MKLALVFVSSTKEEWVEIAAGTYQKKLSKLCTFEQIELKSKNLSREDRDRKKNSDSEMVLSKLQSTDYVVLCDEKGKEFDSITFSQKLQKSFELGKRVVFVVGGAYGLSEEVKKRANLTLKLSDFIMNHHVARVVLLEQIYRAFAIWKNLPYHNE